MDKQEMERILGQVSKEMELLKSVKVGEVPPGLLASVGAMPGWFLFLAVARQWLLPAVTVGGALATVALLLHLSNPLPATLAQRGIGEQARVQSVRDLSAGTTLLAKPGQTLELQVAGGRGKVELEGPGALVVRKASVGKFQGDHRIRLDMPGGSVRIRFEPGAPPHSLLLTTPQAMIGLTGTDVLVQATPVTTLLRVMEGRATVSNLATGERLVVTAGGGVEIQAGWLRKLEAPQGGEEEAPEPSQKPVWMEVK